MEHRWQWTRFRRARDNLFAAARVRPRPLHISANYETDSSVFQLHFAPVVANWGQGEGKVLEFMSAALPSMTVPSSATVGVEWSPPILPTISDVEQHLRAEASAVARQKRLEASGGRDDEAMEVSDEALAAEEAAAERTMSAKAAKAQQNSITLGDGVDGSNSLVRPTVLVRNEVHYQALRADETLILFWHGCWPMNLKELEGIIAYCHFVRAARIILVTDSVSNPQKPVTRFVQERVQRMAALGFSIQLFTVNSLVCSPLASKFCDTLHVLTSDEQSAFFQRYPTYQLGQFKMMPWDDVSRALLDLKADELIEVTNGRGARSFLRVAQPTFGGAHHTPTNSDEDGPGGDDTDSSSDSSDTL
jgi:hypothetical protein